MIVVRMKQIRVSEEVAELLDNLAKEVGGLDHSSVIQGLYDSAALLQEQLDNLATLNNELQHKLDLLTTVAEDI